MIVLFLSKLVTHPLPFKHLTLESQRSWKTYDLVHLCKRTRGGAVHGPPGVADWFNAYGLKIGPALMHVN